MNIVETIKDAVVLNDGGPVVSGEPKPETDIPGAFPDSDDEQEAEVRGQQQPNFSAAPKQQQEQRFHLEPEAKSQRNKGGAEAAIPRSNAMPDLAQATADNNNTVGTAAAKPTSLEDKEGSYPGNHVATPQAGQSARNEFSQAAEAESLSASESLGQYSGAGTTGLDGKFNGGIRNGVLGRGHSHLGPHLGVEAAPKPSSRSSEQTGLEGEEEGRRLSESSSDSSRARRRAADAVLSGVSESGLGMGGVHNGVVGHGSHDEEDARHDRHQH